MSPSTGITLAAATAVAVALAASGCAQAGGFLREFCYVGQGNRFRVNSPDTAAGPYKDRWEAKQTGLLAVAVADDLRQVTRAELYLELWGGHPGVANKRFTLNGRTTYALPEVGAAENHCTYSYPAVELKPAELVDGNNEFQFGCEKGKTFWGHYLIRAACVRLALKDGHPAPREAGLAGFSASVRARADGNETVHLALDCPQALRPRIATVEYWGRYRGYDENGDGNGEDWHGFTKDLRPVGIIAAVGEPPFEARWDLSMVPDSNALAVRAVVRFKDLPGLVYVTGATEGLRTPSRAAQVRLVCSEDLPRPFWSRADRKKACTIVLEEEPSRIERAQLHVCVWDGGKGKIDRPMSLNGVGLETKDWGGRHDLVYTVIELDASALKKGANTVQLHSDTEHHGIEICLPGPALLVRVRAER